MVGTSLSQAIPIAISPIITRLYTPDQFGVFVTIISAITIFGQLCTGRYELAVLLPKKDDEAINLTALAIALSFVSALILLAVVHFFNAPITTALNEPSISPWLYFIPVSIFFIGVYQSLTYYTNRKKYYKKLVTARVADSISNGVGRIGGGFAGLGPAGLFGGNILGYVVGFGLLGLFLRQKEDSLHKKVSWAQMKAMAKKYIEFPKHVVAGQLFYTTSYYIPNILLPTLSFFNSALVGQYGLTNRIVRTPLAVVSSAFADVFKQQASEEYNQTGSCRKVFFRTLRKLILISVLPFAFFFAIAPFLFGFVFGKDWIIAGEYARIMAIPFFLGFTISPLSSVFFIVNKTRQYLLLQLALLILILLAIFVAPLFTNNPYYVVGFISAAYSLILILTMLAMLSFKEVRK